MFRVCQHMGWPRPRFVEEKAAGLRVCSVVVDGQVFVGTEPKTCKKEAKVEAVKLCLELLGFSLFWSGQ